MYREVIAAVLEDLQRETGLNVTQAAKRAKVHPGRMAKWKNGVSLPRDEQLPKIARGYGLSHERLVRRIGRKMIELHPDDRSEDAESIDAAGELEGLRRLRQNSIDLASAPAEQKLALRRVVGAMNNHDLSHGVLLREIESFVEVFCASSSSDSDAHLKDPAEKE